MSFNQIQIENSIVMAEWSKVSDWELRSKAVALIPQLCQQFFTPGLKKNQQGTLSQDRSGLQWP